MSIKGTGVYGMLYGNYRGNATGIKTAGTLNAAILYDKKNQAVSCIGGMFGNIEGTVKNSVNNAKITVSLPNKKVLLSLSHQTNLSTNYENNEEPFSIAVGHDDSHTDSKLQQQETCRKSRNGRSNSQNREHNQIEHTAIPEIRGGDRRRRSRRNTALERA
jgi:hypothetical protein